MAINNYLFIKYFTLFIIAHNGLAMRSVPKGIAYRCCCAPFLFLYFVRAFGQTHSLASFGLCGWLEQLGNVCI